MKHKMIRLPLICLAGRCVLSSAQARDLLKEIQKVGVLRYLGVPYAGFITGDGRGLSVELMQFFAADIGVEYEYVVTNWKDVISDLVGKLNFSSLDCEVKIFPGAV